MNNQETTKIMSVLHAAYPTFYRNVSQYDAEVAARLWAKMFEDEPYKLVEAAVMQHIATDKKGFPPHIGAIKDAVYKLRQPEGEMSEMEAWSAERNFEKLPKLLQRIVGSPEQLAAWAHLDESEVETVVQSNFMRSYKARAQHERERELLPSSLQTAVRELIDKVEIKALEAPEESLGA